MYQIGIFSKITKTTIKALRYYDKVGLLKPGFVNESNGYRYYTTDQLTKLHQIISLKQIGLSIQEIKEVMVSKEFDQILQRKKIALEMQVQDTKQQLSMISCLMKERKGGYFMEYQAIIKELPECIVYSKRTVIPNYNAYFELIPKLGERVLAANPGIKCRVPEYCFVIYHDGEYKEKDIDIEYCEAVTTFGTDLEDVIFKKIESVSAVCVMHKGPYRDLGKAYAYLFKWIAENGYEILDNPRESYIDGIWNKENESEWLTELQVPIKK